MRFKFYSIDAKYCDEMRKHDFRVVINYGKKEGRPFLGIVLRIGTLNYFAPLSSPKEKHKNMKDGVDLIKIGGGKFGVPRASGGDPLLYRSSLLHDECSPRKRG